MAVEAACCGRKEPGGAASDRPCPPSGAALSAAENSSGADRQQLTHAAVADYYGRVLQSSRDLKTSACTAGGKPPELLRQIFAKVPAEVLDKFYGCGATLPTGIDGLTVLDLGSGSGRDCYAAAALVGEHGSVIGVDMTREQLEAARRHADEYCRKQLGYGASNMRFVEGHIEYLDAAGIADSSVDIVVSNCVVNLSPDKARVLSEAYRVLRPGGEFYFSDVYSDRRVSAEAQQDEMLWGECISGALYVNDFLALARSVGFADPRELHRGEIAVHDNGILALVGGARFYSITYRLFKLPGLLEPACEDYGHVVTYKGSIPGQPHSYALDEAHLFEKGRPARACGNTAAMVGEGGLSWLAPHFTVTGDRSTHFGQYEDGTASAAGPGQAQGTAMAASCC